MSPNFLHDSKKSSEEHCYKLKFPNRFTCVVSSQKKEGVRAGLRACVSQLWAGDKPATATKEV